jgi:Uri superfamily endonuclease
LKIPPKNSSRTDHRFPRVLRVLRGLKSVARIPPKRSRSAQKPPDQGVYLLIIYLKRATTIRIGKLGTFRFPRGYYVYVGSAMRALSKRLARHLRRGKKIFWHIDYFLAKASVIETRKYLTPKRLECYLATLFFCREDTTVIAEKFGASDCTCPAHLFFCSSDPRRFLSSISSSMKEEVE